MRPDEAELRWFSPTEMERRRADLLAVAAAAGLDHVLLYGANRSAGAVTWLTQWPVTREAAVVVTPGLQDLLLVSFFNHVPAARRVAHDLDVRYAGPSAVATAAAAIIDRSASSPAVGLVGPVPWQSYRRLEAAVGRIVDLTAAYTTLRMIKSSEELTMLRAAAELTDLSAEALADRLVPGVSEHELVAAVEQAYISKGGSNHIHYISVTAMASPDRWVPSQWPTTRRVQEGDVVTFELSTALAPDYAGQLLRTLTVGADATPLYTELHGVAQDAFAAVSALLRPGTPAAALIDAAALIERCGFTTFDDTVHGFGGGYLPPVLGTPSRMLDGVPDLILEAGMTLVVQPNVCTADLRCGVQVGELMLVTEDGPTSLHHVPRGLRRVC